MRVVFVLWLCIGTALAATHVNISIAQHPATNPADVTYVAGTAPADLRAGPARLINGEERFAKLRAAGEESDAKVQMSGEQKKEVAVASFSSSSQSAQQQVQPYAEQSNSFQQQARFYGRLRQQNRQSQFRQANEQDKRNQEFERYIQNYHKGPSVETVFESSDHTPAARYTSSSSSSSSSSSFASSTSPKSARLVAYADAKPARQQQHTFERQVALPATAAVPTSAVVNEQTNSVADAKIQIAPAAVSAPAPLPTQVTMHVVQVAQPAPSSVSSVSSKTVSSGSNDGGKVDVGSSFGASYGGGASGSHGVTFRVAGGGGSVGGGYQPNYIQGNSYAKPEYEQPNYTYNQGDANGFVNEYPPSVDEQSGGGYDGYYGNQEHNYQSNGGYAPVNPVYQRPLVTKTIQIAQPALKAKKFEVRHPAIQKEFYDIEERVVIKPAGTIVVELEHPVAKIAKGETVLPLGHPHPAIAAQYNQNSDADIETESSSSGSYNNGARSNAKQVYVTASRKQPPPVISATQIGSTVTATSTNNQNAQRDYVEASLRKQYGEEAKLVAPAENTQREQNSRVKDLFVPVDAQQQQSNQRQVSNRNFYSGNNFRREESNYQRTARVELKSNDDIYRAAFSKNEAQPVKNSEPALQSSVNTGADDDEYKGEYVTGNFYSSINKDPKPARLQQAPAMKSERLTAAEPQTQIIKHEHTINLPPSQHNIYIAPSNYESRALLVQEPRKSAPAPKQRPAARLEEETARVQEIKPYLERSRDSVVVYAVPARRPAATQQRYTQNERQQPQYAAQQQQRSYAQLRYEPNSDADSNADIDASVEYSAPYSHMRFVPKESARLTADVTYNRNANANADESQRTFSVNYNRGPDSYARLTAQNQSASEEQKSEKPVTSKVSSKSELRQVAHIQMQVPHGPEEADEPIRIMSSVNPPKSEKVTSKQDVNDQVEQINIQPSAVVQSESAEEEVSASASNIAAAKPDCDQPAEKVSARYVSRQQSAYDSAPYAGEQRGDQYKSQRLIDSSSNSNGNGKESAQGVTTNSQAEVIDGKDAAAAHGAPVGSRVIAANPAPSDASATSESFHKRRIVVNHPFQTVREVVEHEPITNYHQIQVHEPASPASAYHSAPYFSPNGALRQFESHGNLVYVLPDAIPVHENNGEAERTNFSQRSQRS